MFVEQLNGHHETFEAQFIKLIISGDMPIGPESHQDSWIAISNYFWTVIVKDPVSPFRLSQNRYFQSVLDTSRA